MAIQEPEGPKRLATLAEDLVASALALVPIIGGVVEPHFVRAMGAGTAASLAQWHSEVTRTLNAVVELVGADAVEAQLASPEGSAALIATTRAALRDPRPEKLALLGQAVASALTDVEPDGDLRHLFLSLVDRHAVTDVRLLRVLADPMQAAVEVGAADSEISQLSDCIYAVLPGLRPVGGDPRRDLNEDDLLTHYGQGLARDRLLNAWMPETKRYPDPEVDSAWLTSWKLTSVLGDRYLAFLGQAPDAT